MSSHAFRGLTPESAQQWEEAGTALLAACDPYTGRVFTEEELIFSVKGFSGLKIYAIEEGAEVCFPDQGASMNGNRGARVRNLGSCVLLGQRNHLTITCEDGLYRVKCTIPDKKQSY